MNIRKHLMTVTSVTAIALALAACGPSPQQQQQAAYQAGLQAGQQGQYQQAQYQQPAQDLSQRSFSSVQECLSSGQYSQAVCESTYNQSVAALPHYNSYAMCQAQGYGNCEDHGGWFGPAFAGFMLGSMLNGAYHPVPLYLGSGGYIYSPYGSLGYMPRSYYVGGVVHYGIPAGHTTVVIHNYSAAQPLPPVAARPAPVVSRGGMATGVPSAARGNLGTPAATPVAARGGMMGAGPSPARGGMGGFGGSPAPTRQSSGFHMTSSSPRMSSGSSSSFS